MRRQLSKHADVEFHGNGWLEITVRSEAGGRLGGQNVRLVGEEKAVLRELLNNEYAGKTGLAGLMVLL